MDSFEDLFNQAFESLSITERKHVEDIQVETVLNYENSFLVQWKQEIYGYYNSLNDFDKWMIMELLNPLDLLSYEERIKKLCNSYPRHVLLPENFYWLKTQEKLINYSDLNYEEYYQNHWIDNAVFRLSFLIVNSPPLPCDFTVYRPLDKSVHVEDNYKDISNPIFAKNLFKSKSCAFCITETQADESWDRYFEISLSQGNHLLLIPNSFIALIPPGVCFRMKNIKTVSWRLVYQIEQMEKGMISLFGFCKSKTLMEILNYFRINNIDSFSSNSIMQAKIENAFVDSSDLLHSLLRMVLFFYDSDDNPNLFSFQTLDQYVLRIVRQYLVTKCFIEAKQSNVGKRKITRVISPTTEDLFFLQPREKHQKK